MLENRAADYRAMAERALAQADGVKDPAIKSSLLEIATRYAWMAEWIERRAGAAMTDAPAFGKRVPSD